VGGLSAFQARFLAVIAHRNAHWLKLLSPVIVVKRVEKPNCGGYSQAAEDEQGHNKGIRDKTKYNLQRQLTTLNW
jgi:hypothetical protein